MNTEKILNYLRRRTAGDEEVAAADVIERQAAQIEQMLEALGQISQIKNKYNCGDWDEIEEARNIAIASLSTTPEQALEQFAAIRAIKELPK